MYGISYDYSKFQTVTTVDIQAWHTVIKLVEVLFESVFPICIWNIVFRSVVDKDGLNKNRERVFKNDWRNSISRYHFDAVTKLFIKTTFYQTNMVLIRLWNSSFILW